MATKTAGTTASTSLTALKFLPGYGSGMSAADIAAISLAIKNDQNVSRPLVPESFSANGKLYIPGGRGILTCLPGDYVCVDPVSGWPVLVSALAFSIGSAVWNHS